MEAIKWNQYFETGFKTVDDQHHRLVELTNQLGDSVLANRIGFDEIQYLVGQLSDYTKYHFETEETLMTSAGIVERCVRNHKSEHQDFLNYISMHAASLEPDNRTSLMELLSYLTRWLVYHILGEDMRSMRQILAIEKDGLSPTEAYDAVSESQSGTTAILLEALDALFKQLSARNMELTELNRHLEEKVAERTKALSEANKRLAELALTDALTNLPNRRHALSELSHYFFEHVDKNKPLSCLMIDADGFKQMNDSYGHDAGDSVLRELAGALRNSTRTDDFVSRLGGDEFLVLCPETDLEGALQVANTLCQRVAEMQIHAGEGVWNGSISIGVASAGSGIHTGDDLIRTADKSVYKAKQDGKGCVRTVQS